MGRLASLVIACVLATGCSSSTAPDKAAAPEGSDAAPAVPGTYLDEVSGLRWQNPADVKLSNAEAIVYCDNLELGAFPDWRLPSIDEMRSLIVGCAPAATECRAASDCVRTDQCYSAACEGCGRPGSCYLPSEIADTDCSKGQSYDTWFWSSTVITRTADCPPDPCPSCACFGIAWYVDYSAAQVKTTTDTSVLRLRCVRTE